MRKDEIIHDPATEAIISLRYPIQLADRELTEVTMRRPKVRDLMEYDPRNSNDAKAEVFLIGTLCGLKTTEMQEVDAVDYARLQEQFMRFRTDPES